MKMRQLISGEIPISFYPSQCFNPHGYFAWIRNSENSNLDPEKSLRIHNTGYNGTQSELVRLASLLQPKRLKADF